ncbi:MAG: DUF6429 family protein [Promethearchaeota archaeon]
MDLDYDKIDDMALALLYLTAFSDGKSEFESHRAWKEIDWDVSDRLFQKDLIMNPKNKNKSISFTKEGFQRSKQLFESFFMKNEDNK